MHTTYERIDVEVEQVSAQDNWPREAKAALIAILQFQSGLEVAATRHIAASLVIPYGVWPDGRAWEAIVDAAGRE